MILYFQSKATNDRAWRYCIDPTSGRFEPMLGEPMGHGFYGVQVINSVNYESYALFPGESGCPLLPNEFKSNPEVGDWIVNSEWDVGRVIKKKYDNNGTDIITAEFWNIQAGLFEPPQTTDEWHQIRFQDIEPCLGIDIPASENIETPDGAAGKVMWGQLICLNASQYSQASSTTAAPTNLNGAGICNVGYILDLDYWDKGAQAEVMPDDDVIKNCKSFQVGSTDFSGFIFGRIIKTGKSHYVALNYYCGWPRHEFLSNPSWIIKPRYISSNKKCPRISCPDYCGVDQMAMIEFTKNNPCPKCGFPGFIPRNDVCEHKKLRVGYDGLVHCLAEGCEAKWSIRRDNGILLRPNLTLFRLTQKTRHSLVGLSRDHFLCQPALKDLETTEVFVLEPKNDEAKAPAEGWKWPEIDDEIPF